jgi:hypothetical protein
MAPEKVLSLHEAVIERHFSRDRDGKLVEDPVLRTVWRALMESRAHWEQARAAYETINNDASLELGARAARGRKAVSLLAQSAARKLDAARSKLERELADLAKQGRPPAVQDANAACQVRDVVRAMSPSIRLATLASAIENDDSVIAALISAPALVFGMKKDEISGTLRAWRQRRHGALVDRETRIGSALADVDRAGNALAAAVEKLLAPAERLVRSAELSQKAAVAAAVASEVKS